MFQGSKEGAPHNTKMAPVTPPIIKAYTAEDHRRRLLNIQTCEQGITACLRKHLVTDYLPGQVVYNVGEYPSKERWAPNDYDEEELDRLRKRGIQIIQLHHEWNDWQRLFGGDTFTAINPEGLKKFIDMVHARGMKIIAFCSTGWFEKREPAYRPEWARPNDLQQIYFDLAQCSPASPGWRAYMLPRLIRILDDYGIDGLYNDLGYESLSKTGKKPNSDEVMAFADETLQHDAALEDLLSIVYAEVKRRGGIVKLHFGDLRSPRSMSKIYDYLWVGETVHNIDALREGTKNLTPYAVPCLDMMAGNPPREDELYLNSIPYLQFPLLMAGRPFTGERAVVPGIKYASPEVDNVQRHCLDIYEYYKTHPKGPYTYGWWDSVPGRPEARPAHARWLSQYLPMVEEGTRAYLEIANSNFFARPLPANVVSSAFANRDLYLALANYNTTPVQIGTTANYTPIGGESGSNPRNTWDLGPRTLLILKKASS